MKKYLFIIILILLALAATGCYDRNNESPDDNISPGSNYSQSPGNTGPHGSESDYYNNPSNNLGTNQVPGEEPFFNNTDDYIDSMLPVLEISSLKTRNVDSFSDDELKNMIIEEALSKNFNVYDISDVKRSTIDNKEPAVDVNLTFRRLKDNDMASTRFVFKGARVADMYDFEKVAEYFTPLLSKSKESVNNMKIANEKLNGIILRKNEEFSFRYFVGKQTKEEGYKEATVLVEQDNGKVKEEKALGGGICQVSSTLHAACLSIGLKINERHEHSKSVKYIQRDKEAAIAGDYYDLKFENNLDYPIILEFDIDDKTRKEIVRIYKFEYL